jgi:hypothetical protein
VLWVTPFLLEHDRGVFVEHSYYRYHLLSLFAQILLVVEAPGLVVDSSVGLRHNLPFKCGMQNLNLYSDSDWTLRQIYGYPQLCQVACSWIIAGSTSNNFDCDKPEMHYRHNLRGGTLTQFAGRLPNSS